jgi:hypothetical protein
MRQKREAHAPKDVVRSESSADYALLGSGPAIDRTYQTEVLMAERLTKKERKAIIAAKIRDPLTTTAQLIILNKMYDDLSGKTKRLGRPPKDKEPVVDEEYHEAVRRPYDGPPIEPSKEQLLIDKFQREMLEQRERERQAATPQAAGNPAIYTRPIEALPNPDADPHIERLRKAAADPLAVNALVRRIEARRRLEALEPEESSIPRHLQADIN